MATTQSEFWQDLILFGGLFVAFISGAERVTVGLQTLWRRAHSLLALRRNRGLIISPTSEELLRYSRKCTPPPATDDERLEEQTSKYYAKRRKMLLDLYYQQRVLTLVLSFLLAFALVALKSIFIGQSSRF